MEGHRWGWTGEDTAKMSAWGLGTVVIRKEIKILTK